MSGTIDLGEVKLDTRKAQRSLEDLQSSLGSVQTAVEAASSGGGGSRRVSFSGLAEAASEFSKGLGAVGAMAAVATQQIAQFASANERQVVALRGLGSSYQQVRVATNGAVTAQEAFATQNRLTQSHLRVSGDQLASITRAAREFALRTGTDTTQALNQLTEALANGDQRALRPFGINVQVGTLRTQTFRQALGQLQTAQRGTAATAETLTEAQARLGRAWENLRNDTAAATAETLNLKGAFSELADAMESVVEGGPLLQNFFAETLQGILGIQQARAGTSEDNRRRQAVEERIALGSAMQRFGGLTIDGNINRLSADQAIGLRRILNRPGITREQAQEAIDRAMGVARTVDARERVTANQPTQTTPAQAAAEDMAERTRDMSETDVFSLREDQRQAREQVDQTIRQLASQGVRVPPAYRQRLLSLIGGFIVPMNRLRFQRELARLQGQSTGFRTNQFGGLGRVMERYGSNLTNEQYTALLESDRDKQRAINEEANARAPGYAGRMVVGGSIELGTSMGGQTFVDKNGRVQTFGGPETIVQRYGTGLRSEIYQQLAENERGKDAARQQMGEASAAFMRRDDLSVQVGSFFSDTQTLAEKGAKGFENAFNTMSGSVSSFIDTLIEGQVPAGEAAVGLAKAALKGLAMQAVPEALFETAKGFAALAMGDPRAAIHFTAAGIYAAVGVAAGGAAAGISAAQRAGQAPSASASMSAGGFTSPGGSNTSRDNRPIVINVNGAIMDREGFSNAVLDGVNDALARGGRMAV